MYAGGAYSEFSYAHFEAVPLDPVAGVTFLERAATKFCWLLEIDAFPLVSVEGVSAGYAASGYAGLGYAAHPTTLSVGEQTQYFSTHDYTSRAGDAPASTLYPALLAGGGVTSRRIAGRDGVGGLARVFAEVTLINADGALDQWLEQYAVDGRRVRLLLGERDAPRSEFVQVFAGVIEKAPVIGRLSVRLQLSDGASRLEVPVQTTVYAGSGGTEGGDDLKGKPKPLAYGHAFNISPALVDSTDLIYQVHDGAISDVPNVWDRGVALAKVGGAPAAGQYQVNAAAGTFKLGATPAGTVTCDAKGDASLSGYVDVVADIVRRVLIAKGGLASGEIDSASFDRLRTKTPGAVGIWIGPEPRNVDQVVDELLAGVGAFGGFSRAGAFAVGLVESALAEPISAPVATYSEEDILDLRRISLPEGLDPLAWRVLVGWQRNYTVQTDFAASVSAARRTFAAEAMRVAESANSAIRSRHRLAREYALSGALYAAKADAEAKALELFDLWSKDPAMFEVDLPAKAIPRELGESIELRYPRFGQQAGRAARVLNYNRSGRLVTLTVLA